MLAMLIAYLAIVAILAVAWITHKILAWKRRGK
jgi:hypothetical protein